MHKTSQSQTITPSILTSSHKHINKNSTSNKNPPLNKLSTIQTNNNIKHITNNTITHKPNNKNKIKQFNKNQLTKHNKHTLNINIKKINQQIITNHQNTIKTNTTNKLLKLKNKQSPITTQLNNITNNLITNTPNHLKTLNNNNNIPHNNKILNLKNQQNTNNLIKTQLITLEHNQHLINPQQNHTKILKHIPTIPNIQNNNPHRLTNNNNQITNLLHDTLNNTITNTKLNNLNKKIKHKLNTNAQNAQNLTITNNHTIHLNQLAQTYKQKLDIKQKPTTKQTLNNTIIPKHNEHTHTATQNTLQTITKQHTQHNYNQNHSQQIILTKLYIHHIHPLLTNIPLTSHYNTTQKYHHNTILTTINTNTKNINHSNNTQHH